MKVEKERKMVLMTEADLPRTIRGMNVEDPHFKVQVLARCELPDIYYALVAELKIDQPMVDGCIREEVLELREYLCSCDICSKELSKLIVAVTARYVDWEACCGELMHWAMWTLCVLNLWPHATIELTNYKEDIWSTNEMF